MKISLIIPTQGNTTALKRTIESFKDVVSEIIIGSLCVFEEDSEIIQSYTNQYNLVKIDYKFDTIFKYGFSEILNNLSKWATNDLVLYMNCSEILDGEERINRLLEEKFSPYNCFAIDHASDPHTWHRLYNKNEIQWQGIIHEELRGNRNDCPYYLFRFKDTEKDTQNPFKAKVYNDIKEIVYGQQYINLVECPEKRSITNEWWLNFAKDNYESLKHRLFDKRERYEAFIEGDLGKYLRAINDSPEFEKERFESSNLIEFQGSYKSL